LFLTKAPDAPLKIIDFGMSKFVKRREYFNVICGTPYYVAPEVISGKYSEHCDMWSLGVVMFVMLFGYPPFYADQEVHGPYTDERIFALVKKGFEAVTKDGYGPHFPKAIPISESAKDLISKLLTLDTAKRHTASEALEHPWLLGSTAESKPLVQSVVRNLSNFSANFKFKQSILMLMSDSLSDTELSSLKLTFRQIDKNDDGKITVAEMKEAIEKYGSANESKGTAMTDVAAIMKSADVDGDGSLSYNELLMTAVQRKLLAKEERLWDAFRKLDLNGDGKITKDEIRKVLGEEAANDMIAAADTNGDGDIDYDEFITVWAQNHPDSIDNKDNKEEKINANNNEKNIKTEKN
jgi:calcium-dependent protein kinase